jgi:hypothetical protein
MPRTGLGGVGSYSSLLPLNGANIPAAYSAPRIGADYHPSMRILRQSNPAQRLAPLIGPMSLPMTLVNDVDAPRLSVSDRGLAYGDGLFDTMAVIDGEMLNSNAHFTPRQRDCQRLGTTCPDVSLLAVDTLTVTLALAFERSVVKLTITRGSGARGYTPAVSLHPPRSVACSEWPTAYSSHEGNGVTVCIVNHRLCMNPQLTGLKLNRLDQVMASRELAKTTGQEALMLDDIGTTYYIGERSQAPQNALIAGNYHR